MKELEYDRNPFFLEIFAWKLFFELLETYQSESKSQA